MVDVLHAWAVAPAALGTCCVAVDRGRTRAAHLAASALMTIAMLDAAVFGIVPALWWACVLVASALVFAVVTRSRRAGDRVHDDGAMNVHTGVGLVAMAALLLIMAAPAGAVEHGHHAHGSGAAIAVALAVAYGGASVLLARRGPALERIQYLTMGAATVLMGAAALL